MNDSYCPLMFHGIYIERFSDFRNSVAPCCLAGKSHANKEAIDFISDPHLKSIREASKNNTRSEHCRACWNTEDAGGISRRQVEITKYRDLGIPLDTNLDIRSLDYNTLPICNAKCVICSPRFSSTWAAATGRRTILKYVNTDQAHIESLDMSSLTSVYFNGGEPLLTDEHLAVLERINDISQCEISYNTNGSCRPTAQALELWKQAKKVTLFFSIDAIKDRFEIVRTPLKWKEVSENIIQANESGITNIGCSFTAGRHNLFDLSETIDWFSTLKGFDVKSQFHVHLVDRTHDLFFDRASVIELDRYLNEIEKFKGFYWCYNLINTLTRIKDGKTRKKT